LCLFLDLWIINEPRTNIILGKAFELKLARSF